MRRLLPRAKQELAEAKVESDPDEANTSLRQASEKAWGDLVANVTLIGEIEEEGREAWKARKTFLKGLDALTGTSLLDDYEKVQRLLHGDCFYEGECDPGQVDELVRLVEQFPARVKAAKIAAAEAARARGVQ